MEGWRDGGGKRKGGGLCFSTGGLNVTTVRDLMEPTSCFLGPQLENEHRNRVCFWNPSDEFELRCTFMRFVQFMFHLTSLKSQAFCSSM